MVVKYVVACRSTFLLTVGTNKAFCYPETMPGSFLNKVKVFLLHLWREVTMGLLNVVLHSPSQVNSDEIQRLYTLVLLLCWRPENISIW